MPVNLWLPRTFNIFGIETYTYDVIVFFGLLIFLLIFFIEARKTGMSKRQATWLGLIIILAGIGASILITQLTGREWHLYLYTAAPGAIIGGWIYARRRKISLFKIGDAAAPAAVLSLGVMKLGCLISGCCFGIPTNNKIFAIYQMPRQGLIPKALLIHPEWNNIPLEPVQLWTALLCFGVFILSYLIRPLTKKTYGQQLGFILAIYATGRFTIDFASGSPNQFGPLTANQYGGLLMIILSLIILYKSKRRIRTR